MPKLPALGERDAMAFFAEFAMDWDKQGLKVTGRSRIGPPFSIHLDHDSHGMRADVLGKALTYLAVSREEFFDWYSRR